MSFHHLPSLSFLLLAKRRLSSTHGSYRGHRQLGTAIGAIRSELDSSARSHLTTSEDVKKNLIKKVDEFIKEREGQRRSVSIGLDSDGCMCGGVRLIGDSMDSIFGFGVTGASEYREIVQDEGSVLDLRTEGERPVTPHSMSFPTL